jgi:hypothetical protein
LTHKYTPSHPELRAHKVAHVWREPREYLERDQTIVTECDVLIAAPSTFRPVEPSGTWTTVDFARTSQKPILLVLPNGSFKKLNYA